MLAGTQAVSLQQNDANQRFALAPAVTTTFVRIVVTSVYTSKNNGAKEISFEGSPASTTKNETTGTGTGRYPLLDTKHAPRPRHCFRIRF